MGPEDQHSAASIAASVGDPLGEVRTLKWRVQIFVYVAIFATEPFYYFVLDFTWLQLLPGLAIGLGIAFTAIEGAFSRMFKLRKRSAYPGVLHQELGTVAGEDAAGERALRVISHLLCVDEGCIAIKRPDGLLVKWVLRGSMDGHQSCIGKLAQAIDKAIRTGEPVEAGVPATSPEDAEGPGVVVVPLVALELTTGVLVLRERPGADLSDAQLLKDIGVALALSLENWRQREELRKSEDRIKTVVTNVPVILFAIDKEGVFTLSEGKGLDDLDLKPGQVVGLNVTDVYSDVPEILENVARALHGESRTITVEVGGFWWETSYSPVFDSEAGEVVGLIGVAANVTERKKAEDELRLVQSSVDRAEEAIFWIGPDARILNVNSAACKSLGYERDELLGMRVPDIDPGVTEEEWPDRWTMMREQKFSNVESTHQRKDGSTFPVEVHSNFLEFGGQEFDLAFARDITERIASSEALRHSEEKYRDLVENSNEIIYTLDSSAIVTYISPAVEAIGGFKPEEVIGRRSTEFIHPDDIAEVAISLQKVLQGELDPTEYRLRTKSGGYRWVRSASKPIYEDSTIVGVRGVLVDITDKRAAEDALRASEKRFRALVENGADGITLLDADGTITYAGPSTESIRGYTPEEMVGRPLSELVHPDDLEAVNVVKSDLLEAPGEAMPMIYRAKHKDGSWLWLEAVATNLLGDPSVAAIVVNYRDITERKLADEALRQSEENHRALAVAIPDVMMRVRKDGTISDFKADERHVLSLAEVGSEKMVLAEVLPELAPQLMRFVDIAISTHETQVFEYQQSVSGKPLEFEARIVASSDDEAVAIIRDITERKNSERTIRQLAYHDALTGLPNRTLFEDRLTVAVAQARRAGEALAVMFLDLDRFKLVNDTLGHGAGDKLLTMVGDEISGLLRDGDTVARVGGDEFTLLLPRVSGSEDATDVADRILAQLKKPKRIAGQEFRVTTSIGVTLFPGDGDDPETLLRNADTAMYRAKERGRDNYQLFTPAMNASVVQRLALERDLRRALEREEFEVYYQPCASIADGRIVGAEALVRWNHPERGLVMPDEFIPLAEETGLIIPLGEWVLTEAVHRAKKWIAGGLPPLRLAVNLSALQLQHEPLVAMVSSVLKSCRVPAERLQLEITEGAMMDNVESAIRIVKELRHLGVSVAVDDFGTGYSSLSYLKRFPIDTVKIDRSFVRDLTIDPNDAAIVTTILAMARSLGLHVVAEGVETRQQLEFLREHGCDEFQGYLLSRPIPAAEYEKLVSAAEMARPRKSGLRKSGRRAAARR